VVTFVLATTNPDKAREIAAILPGVTLVPRPIEVPDVIEDGETLLDNARKKARAIAQATGLAAIADDTGLFVDALGGAPGVHSARYAGPGATYADNVDKLLDALAGQPIDRRSARFVTVAVVTYPDGTEVSAQGELAGTITSERRGDGGFGYDPIFAPEDGGGRTLAQYSANEKDLLSHRGRAFRSLAEEIDAT
jgi:XTP/dITP diphosphohydrolase